MKNLDRVVEHDYKFLNQNVRKILDGVTTSRTT
jgi:hypothetical protein